MNNLPISEAITALVAATIAWFTHGRLAAKSTDIDNTAKLIELWERANHNCQKELDEMREEIKQVRLEASGERERLNDEVLRLKQEIKVLRGHISKLEKA
jgi:peptidoglycan hydrolase CwlO-like protein